MTLDTGIPVISTCRKTGFHEHINNPPLYVVIYLKRFYFLFIYLFIYFIDCITYKS